MTDSLSHMISRRFSARQKVVALAPLLLLALYVPGQAMLRCRMDGLLRAACCCPQESEAQDAGPVVKAQDCCDPELTANERPVVEVARSAAADVASAASYSILPAFGALVLIERARSERAWREHGPPAKGPTIVLLKHAFLI
jgi:hypothetical protein